MPEICGKYFLLFPQKMYKLRQQFVYFLRGVFLLFNFWTIKSMSNLLISPTTDFIELFEPMEHAISPIFSSKSFCLSEKNKRKIITVNQSSFYYFFHLSLFVEFYWFHQYFSEFSELHSKHHQPIQGIQYDCQVSDQEHLSKVDIIFVNANYRGSPDNTDFWELKISC